jgi:hypothetical protein
MEPPRKQKRGRPKTNWRRSVIKVSGLELESTTVLGG